jgi:HlyD family secretion protein
MKQLIRRAGISLAVVIVLISAIVAWRAYRSGNNKDMVYQTASVVRGDLLVTISATGTIEPEEVVDVGAQVAGQILSFGNDANGHSIDYGSQVAEGTVLARIDASIYKSAVESAVAQKQAAEANLHRSESDLGQYQAKFNQAERDWKRAQKIGPSEALSQTNYDSYLSGYESAKSNVAVAQAAIQQAKANLAQSQAQLDSAKRNLGYCTIKSPVKGVIIDRRVTIGETVVSSLNAPSLFLIAKDLTHMEVWVSVNEADIGKIHPEQNATFTVDAYPDEMFKGTVNKVRLNASMTQNVVTYTVVISTNNANGKLLPYLTANVQFEIQHAKDVLEVPNAALRWTPEPSQISPQFRNAMQQKVQASGRGVSRSESEKNSGEETQRLWTPEGEHVRPIWVRAGISDRIETEVEGEGLYEGMPVVTGMISPGSEADNTANTSSPFALRFNRGRGNQQPQQSKQSQ